MYQGGTGSACSGISEEWAVTAATDEGSGTGWLRESCTAQKQTVGVWQNQVWLCSLCNAWKSPKC